ncbi:MAG: preprotein translocase subunit SecE [Nitrospiraceae bacterium]|nr:preprotein translocase subunit SecE [Nitrospiraceae bacterium]
MSKKTNEKRRIKKATTVSRSNQTQVAKAKKESFKNFLSGVWIELTKKVIWPTAKQLWSYTAIVLTFVIFWATYIGLWDMLFAKGLEALAK